MSDLERMIDEQIAKHYKIVFSQTVRRTDLSERSRTVLQRCKTLQKHYSDLFDHLIQDSTFMDLKGDGSRNLESDGGRLLTIDMESMELSKNFEKNQFGDPKGRHFSPQDVKGDKGFWKRKEALRKYDLSCKSELVTFGLCLEADKEGKRPCLTQNRHETICRDIQSCCNEFGEEQHLLLKFTAPYFNRLGREYLLHDRCGDGMDRKLNFIRAAVLMNAARVRYEMYLQKDDVLEDLRVLYTKLLQSSGAQHFVDFVAFTKKIKVELKAFRDAEQDALKHIQTLRDDNIDGNLIETQENFVIEKIRELCASTTKNYRTLLTEIISQCLYVMGEPPCEFAIVGLGSLAREEVTLSSDFEHAIVLEDQKPVTNEVREYFRWFTLIFHVVVIGLGETVIPSIDIEFLCDPYSTEEHHNCFFDRYTPRGFSFDGMMPHACKTPFGRQRPTKNRKHVVELIQSASAMAHYLTMEEQIKNGYALNDVLTTTCLVYGNRDVYHSFLEKSKSIRSSLSINDVYEQQRSFLRDAVKAFKSLFDDSSPRDFKLKKWIYRPLTVMLHYLACHFKLSSGSSFDILDDLKEKCIIHEASHHLLCHAVGIALEIRMRIYQSTSGQRHNAIDKDVSELLGSILYAECRSATFFLIRAVQNLTHQSIYMREKILRLGFPSRTTDIWRSMVLQSQRKIDNDNDLTCISFINHLSFVENILEQYGTKNITTFLAHLLVRIHTSEALFRLNNFTKLTESRIPNQHRLLMEAFEWLLQRFQLLGSSVEMDFSLTLTQTKQFLDAASKGISKPGKNELVVKAGDYEEVCTSFDAWNDKVRCLVNNYWERPEYIQELDGICKLEYSMQKYALSDIDAACYFSLALTRITQTHFTKILFMLGLLRSVKSCGTFIDETGIYWRLREQAMLIKRYGKHFTIREYIYLKKTIAKLFLELGMTGASSEVLDSMIFSPEDVSKWSGTMYSYMLYSDVSNGSFSVGMFAKLLPKYLGHRNLSLHPRLPFHEITATGRYTNRKFNGRRCDTKLFEAAIQAQQRHTRLIFSCTHYDEMITAVECVLLGPERLIPKFEHRGYKEEVTANEVVAFLALCENVKYRDAHLFYDMLNKASLKVRSAKILQPFIYACFKEFNPQSGVDERVIRIQNDLFQKIFHIHIQSTDASITLSTFHYLNLNFADSAIVAWRMLQTKVETESKISVFLTSVMAMMVVRKRRHPIPHLRKCKELSAVQATVYIVDRRILNTHFYISRGLSFCKPADSLDNLCYNMAVDWMIFDPRAGAAMMWKLMQRGKSDSRLNWQYCSQLLLALVQVRPTLINGFLRDDHIIHHTVSATENFFMFLKSVFLT